MNTFMHTVFFLAFLSSINSSYAADNTENQPNITIDACEKLKGIKRSQCFESLAKQQENEKRLINDKDVFISNLIKDIKNKLTSNFKDPASSIYRSTSLKQNDSRYVLCGEVNAKNSYGGYTGFKRFISRKHANGEITSSFEGEAQSTESEYPGMSKQLNAIVNDVFKTFWEMDCDESAKGQVLRDNIS